MKSDRSYAVADIWRLFDNEAEQVIMFYDKGSQEMFYKNLFFKENANPLSVGKVVQQTK